MDLGAIRAWIETHLDVDGFVTVGAPGGTFDLPALVLGNQRGVDYLNTYEGTSTILIPLHCVVDRADDDVARAQIDRAVSTVAGPGTDEDPARGVGSVFLGLMAMIEAAGELPLVDRPWQSASFTGSDEPGTTDVGNTPCVQVDFLLSITARNNLP